MEILIEISKGFLVKTCNSFLKIEVYLKILHVSNTDLVGGRFTGHSMVKAIKKGNDAEMAVWERQSEILGVHNLKPLKPSFLWFLTKIAKKFDDHLALEGLTGLAGLLLLKKPYFDDSDVIHFHLIHNSAFFSILSIPQLSHLKPIVWTIHDNWAYTGMCVYSFDCDKWLTGCKMFCPYPRGFSSLRHYMPSLHWKMKSRIYRRSELNLVAASKWTFNRITKSPLLNKFPIHIIPYGVDLQTFIPQNKEKTREKLGLNPNQRIIAFRGVKINNDQYKGMSWLKEALILYEPQIPTSLLILQDGSDFASLGSKYNILNLGWIDGSNLVDVLCAADVFVMPSIQEAFGLMAVETMACGTPVIVFDGTALPEVIHEPLGGLVVPSMNFTELAKVISLLLGDNELRRKIGRQGRQIAEQEYSLKLYIERHIKLYTKIIDNRLKRSEK